MFFKHYAIIFMLVILQACSNEGDESRVTGIVNVANQDIVAVSFIPTDSDIIISTGARHPFTVLGTHSSGSTSILNNNDLIWQLSSGAISTITESGFLDASLQQENITLTANFAHLSTTASIKISAAKFDRIAALQPGSPLNVQVCQNTVFVPLGLYIDDFANEVIRPVDNNIMQAISWNTSDNISTPSQRVFIENNVYDATLFSLSSGQVTITATALSVYDNTIKTSTAFIADITPDILALKLCKDTTTDYSACSPIDTIQMNNGNARELIAVGSYPDLNNGPTIYKNITRTTKWGTDNFDNLAISYDGVTVDDESVVLTAKMEDTLTTINAVCGLINETLPNDLSQGIILNTAISCDVSDLACLDSSAAVTVNTITTESLTVQSDGITFVDNVEQAISQSSSLVLNITANQSDNTSINITNDPLTIYKINGSGDVPLEETATAGIFNIIHPGAASLSISYGGQIFTLLLNIP